MIIALGVAQLISWGTLFYAIGVLGPAMRADLGVSEVFLFGGFTAGLLLSGTLAPLLGRWIDERGGRFVLSVGSAVAVIAFAALATATGPIQLVLGLLFAGIAMAACLYDSAFATVSQHAGARYRIAVTTLTVFGGFASTVFWPLSYILSQAWGWRICLGLYAGLHLFICFPIHRLFVPKTFGRTRSGAASDAPLRSPAMGTARLRWLTVSFAIGTFVISVIAVHVVSILTQAGLTAAQAVSLSMLIGPMQVVGRVLELGLARRVRAVTVGIAAFSLLLIGLVALLMVQGAGIVALLFVVAYGCGNGLLTIVRGIAPAEIFGREALGSLLGYLSRAALFSRALAPASFSAMLAIGFSHHDSLLTLAGLALAALMSFSLAARAGRAPA